MTHCYRLLRFMTAWLCVYNLSHGVLERERKSIYILKPSHTASTVLSGWILKLLLQLPLLMLGAPGSIADSRLFGTISLYKAMGRNEATEEGIPVGHYAIAGSGFAQRPWVFVPFPRRYLESESHAHRCKVYNFRLSQIRVVSENCFGRLKGRWRILLCLPYGPEVSSLVIQSCYTLHNFLEQHRVPIFASWVASLLASEIEVTSLAGSGYY